MLLVVCLLWLRLLLQGLLPTRACCEVCALNETGVSLLRWLLHLELWRRVRLCLWWLLRLLWLWCVVLVVRLLLLREKGAACLGARRGGVFARICLQVVLFAWPWLSFHVLCAGRHLHAV